MAGFQLVDSDGWLGLTRMYRCNPVNCLITHSHPTGNWKHDRFH